ncbi:MAG: metal-sensitive transcriptional regulator [Fimbriimonadaceae bacterium]|nr:metal-sensitive transcriptional regulator [Fimbriimonadaceae bacterium]
MNAKGLQTTLDRRLARIEGQVRGLRRMVGEGAYCIDVLDQLSAVQAALDQFGARLAVSHIEGCILGSGEVSAHPGSQGLTKEEKLHELQKTLVKLMR